MPLRVSTLPAPSSALTLVINEINSSPDDWVELMNTGSEALDLSGFELRDNSDDHRWQFADGSIIAAGGMLVAEAATSGLAYDDQAKAYANGSFCRLR